MAPLRAPLLFLGLLVGAAAARGRSPPSGAPKPGPQRNRFTRSPLSFSGDDGLQVSCGQEEEAIYTEEDPLSRLRNAYSFIKCLLNEYGKLYSRLRSFNDDFHIKEIVQICNRVRNAIIYDSYFLDPRRTRMENLRSTCIPRMHVERLLLSCGLAAPSGTEHRLRECYDLQDQAVLEDDSINTAIVTGEALKCVLRMFPIAIECVKRRVPLTGKEALLPKRMPDERADRILPPATVPPARLARRRVVRFVGISPFNMCVPAWAVGKNFRDRIERIDNHIMVLMAQSIGFPFCRNVNDLRLVNKGLRDGVFDVHIKPMWQSPRFDVQFLYPHSHQDLCLAIRRPKPKRRSILNSFTSETWLATGILLLAFVAALRLAGRDAAPLEAVRTFLTGAFDERQRPLVNFLGLLLSAFGLIIVNAFAGVFMGFLMVPRDPPLPQTLLEANDLFSKVTGSWTLVAACPKDDMDDVCWKILAKMNKDGDYVRKGRNAILGPKPALEVFINLQNKIWERSNPLYEPLDYYIVPECLHSPAYMMYHVRNRWPYYDHLNNMLLRVVESGYPRMLLNAYTSAMQRRYNRGDPPEEILKALVVSDVREPSMLLVTGLLLAAAAFMIELIADRWQRRARNAEELRVRRSSAVGRQRRGHMAVAGPAPIGPTELPRAANGERRCSPVPAPGAGPQAH